MVIQSVPATFLPCSNELTMTSIEISELVGSRHDKVKQSIERLAKKGVITAPPMGIAENINNLGFNVKSEFYVFKGEQGKRDSIIVIAQLCPKYTAKIVDRWQELEANAYQPIKLPTTKELAYLLIESEEAKERMAVQMALDAPKVKFAELVGEADGVLIGNYAKTINFGQNKLFEWLRENEILHTQGNKYNTPRDEYIRRCYFTCKAVPVATSRGVKEKFTTHITGKGQLWLTEKLKTAGLIQK